MSSAQSSLLLRRRGSQTRRQSAAKLGAVKLAAGAPSSDCGSDGPSPSHSVASSVGAVTPQDRSPLITRNTSGPSSAVHTAATASAATPPPAATQSQRQHPQLKHAHSSDAWLDSQLTPPSSSGVGSTGAAQQARALSHRSPSLANVESAASQIVSKAMQYLTVSERGGSVGPAKAPLRSPKFDSNSLLDKGLDAITGVGKIMEGFALTLDSVIGQAFEEWQTGGSSSASKAPVPHNMQQASAAPVPLRPVQPQPSSSDTTSTTAAAAAAWEDAGNGSAPASAKENAAPAAGAGRKGSAGSGSGRQAQVTSFMSKINAASEVEVQEWRRRAQQLAAELQKIKEQQEEYARIKEAYEALQAREAAAAAAPPAASSKPAGAAAPAAAAPAPEPAGPAAGASAPTVADPCLADPLAAQQVTRQMELLLVEKARLAQENARLLRENTGLQELLEFSMQQQAMMVGEDELYGYGELPQEMWPGDEEVEVPPAAAAALVSTPAAS